MDDSSCGKVLSDSSPSSPSSRNLSTSFSSPANRVYAAHEEEFVDTRLQKRLMISWDDEKCVTKSSITCKSHASLCTTTRAPPLSKLVAISWLATAADDHRNFLWGEDDFTALVSIVLRMMNSWRSFLILLDCSPNLTEMLLSPKAHAQ